MRPVVKLHEQTAIDGHSTWTAVCNTGTCTWESNPHHVKTGAQEEARWHRDTHRQEAAHADAS